MVNTLWVEKYRPIKLDDYIGNDFIKDKVKLYLESGDIPHLLLYGKAGTGKTTLAKLIVKNIDCDHMYINASDERNIDLVRDKLKNFASSVGFSPLKVVILDEADYLNPNSAQPALRNLMETFSKHCRFILTGNYVERIIDPIQSRCQSFQVIPPDRKQVAGRVYDILKEEDITFDTKDIAMLVNGGYPDIRRVINSCQRQSVSGELVIDKQSSVLNDYKVKLLEMLIERHKGNIEKKDSFMNIRKLLADSKVTDFNDAFRLLYDNVDEFAKGNVAAVILMLAQYQTSDVQVVDKEINFMACLIEILGVI